MTTITWESMRLLETNLTNYLFGSEIVLAVIVLCFFLILLLGGGLELKYAAVFVLPLAAAYMIGGAFGVNVWILHTAIILAGLAYSSAVVKVMS